MGNAERSVEPSTRSHNRIFAVMMHTRGYAFRGTSRLARDAGVAKSTVSNLLRGKTKPLYITISRLVKCLESQLGLPLDPKELLSETGQYPTPFICYLVGCPGCLPDSVYDQDGVRKRKYGAVRSGQWTGDVDEFPKGKR